MSITNLRLPLTCLLLVAFSSCGTSGSESDAEEARQTSERRAAARLTPGWLDPMTLELHGSADEPDDADLVLRGMLDGWLFLPQGEIIGRLRTAPVSATLKKCRLVVGNRSLLFEQDETPRGVTFLDGSYDTKTQLFYPSSRQCAISQ